MKIILFLFVFCLPTLVWACQHDNYHFQDNQLLLSTRDNTQQLYLLHNQSNQAIYINHQKIPAGASAGWMSQLDPQHWSAIATKQKNFALTCTLAQPGNFAAQPCQNFLTVCFVPQATFPNNLRHGGFWMTENKTVQETTAAIEKRGIKISN
jgi:hypothetical protein